MAGVCWQSVGRRVRITLGKYTTIFQAEVYAVLAFVYEIQTQIRPEKYVSICYNSWAALKVLRASKRKSPLVQQCQKALNYISARCTVGLYWVPGHAGLRGNEIAD